MKRRTLLCFRLPYLLLATLFSSAAIAQLTDEEIRELAAQARGYTNINKDRLTAEDKKSLIQFLYRHASEPGNKGVYDEFLVTLGDEAMIERFAKERFRQDGVATVRVLFAKSGSPKAVEVLVPYLLKEERYERFGGDVPSVPISFFAAAAIPMTLGNSPSFSPEVIQWAQRINNPNGHIEYPEIREVMRDWWRANERFFKEKNYKAVQPGREPKVIPPPPLTEPPPVSAAATTVPPAPAPALPETETTQSATGSSWLGFAIIAGCAALLAAGLGFFARRAGKG